VTAIELFLYTKIVEVRSARVVTSRGGCVVAASATPGAILIWRGN